MSISYKHISQKPIIFNRLVGMKVKDFEYILENVAMQLTTLPTICSG